MSRIQGELRENIDEITDRINEVEDTIPDFSSSIATRVSSG